MHDLIIKDLHVKAGEKNIIKGINLTVKAGEITALMGPNGSGKSTLSNVLMGHPGYEITKGSITYKGEDITEMSPDERSRLGMFLSFQHPTEIPGLLVSDFLREITKTARDKDINIVAFKKLLREKMDSLGINPQFAKRHLNQSFSGGEKKRMEILQMTLLEPTLAIMDETDSGLDIDALRAVAKGVNKLRNDATSVLVITHYKRILNYLKPNRVVILMDGRIVKEGGPELVDKLEAEGYAWMQE